MSIKIMLADDHTLIRDGLKKLIELENEFKVVEEAIDGEDCLNKIEVTKPDILLLDINMPKLNGIEVVEKLKNNDTVKIIILTVHDEIEYLFKVLELGVRGYVLKDAGFEELKKAIKCVFNNEKYIQPSLIPALNSKLILKDLEKNKLELLTNRKIQVLKSITNGKFNREIAIELKISEQTVKNHISNIFKKIDVVDRTQAAVFAIKNDIVKIN